MKNRFLTLLLAAMGWLSTANAQIVNPDKVKYGKFSDAELALEEYELQPDAEAVVLIDKGELRMEYDPSTGNFEMVMERHRRIKVLRASGTDYGDFSILLENSTSSSAKEEVVGIRGMTINVEGGKAVETKLERQSIFREKISERLQRLTISFPQVKVGAIIDLKYTYNSDYLYNLPTWYFQRSIPTDYSYFSAVIPEYFYYNLDMKGYASSSLTESVVAETGNRTMNLGTPKAGKGNLSFRTRGYRWTAVEVPGMQSEDYAPHVSNYFFRIDFELASINYPGFSSSEFSNTWDNVAKTYRASTILQSYLEPHKEVEALAQEWLAETEGEAEKVVTLYERVKERFEWNGSYRISPGQKATTLLEKSSGSSADLNSFLISSLRAAGLTAFPVLVSTRENGYLTPTRPSLSQFNHQLVFVSLGEGQDYLLLDATHRSMPATLLPTADLNDRGRIVKEEESSWIDLQAPASRKVAVQLKLAIGETGTCEGSMKYKASDYAAHFDRLAAQSADGLGETLSDRFGHTLTEPTVEGFTDLYSDLQLKSSIAASDGVMQAENMLYVPAVLTTPFTENPLKTEERLLPIDFETPQDYVYVLNLEIPEGMVVEELPESATFALEEGTARYSIRYSEMNGNVQVVEKISIKSTFFGASEYPALKSFFDLVIEQQQNMLVLSKE
ncbi:MAG: DUF3857 domain-containing protein [Bacteroidota bacterium]